MVNRYCIGSHRSLRVSGVGLSASECCLGMIMIWKLPENRTGHTRVSGDISQIQKGTILCIGWTRQHRNSLFSLFLTRAPSKQARLIGSCMTLHKHNATPKIYLFRPLIKRSFINQDLLLGSILVHILCFL